MDLKVRRPHSDYIDIALEKGKVDIPPSSGLYLSRMRHELQGVIDIEPLRPDVFRATRSVEALRKVGESHSYAHYRRLGKRIKDILG